MFDSIFLKIGIEFDATWQAVLYMLCGLGIFLFGINMMGSSLKKIAGNKMKMIIEKSTSTPLKGMVVGFVVTMLTQSASGTSALAVGLVASGLMSFEQSLGILLGANIGGTVLTIVLAAFSNLKIMPIVSVILVFIGAFTYFFVQKAKVKQYGSVILGFGLIFLGLAFIDMSFEYIMTEHKEAINTLFENLSAIPEVGMLVGVLFTMIVQSSSATIGIVQSLYSTTTISLYGSLAIMLGANLGTTITAVITSLGSSKAAKKVAFANVLIKFFGLALFGILYRWAYYPLVNAVNSAWFGESSNPMIIALAHLFFNIINSAIMLLLLKPLVKITDYVIKENEEETILEQLLDYSLIQKSPSLALAFAKKAVVYMASMCEELINLTSDFVFSNNQEDVEKGRELERVINVLDKRIHDYLVKVTIKGLDSDSSAKLSKFLDAIKDLERVGDQCMNIIDFFIERFSNNLSLSDDGTQDLSQIFNTLSKLIVITKDAIDGWDSKLCDEGFILEDEIDKMEEVFHQRHVHRVESGACLYANSQHYVETLLNIERIGDHLTNILEAIKNVEFCNYAELEH